MWFSLEWMCVIQVKAELVPGAADLTLSLPLVTELLWEEPAPGEEWRSEPTCACARSEASGALARHASWAGRGAACQLWHQMSLKPCGVIE